MAKQSVKPKLLAYCAQYCHASNAYKVGGEADIFRYALTRQLQFQIGMNLVKVVNADLTETRFFLVQAFYHGYHTFACVISP